MWSHETSCKATKHSLAGLYQDERSKTSQLDKTTMNSHTGGDGMPEMLGPWLPNTGEPHWQSKPTLQAYVLLSMPSSEGGRPSV